MKAALRLLPGLGLAALLIRGHEHGAHTWAPMFHLILVAITLPAAWSGLAPRNADRSIRAFGPHVVTNHDLRRVVAFPVSR